MAPQQVNIRIEFSGVCVSLRYPASLNHLVHALVGHLSITHQPADCSEITVSVKEDKTFHVCSALRDIEAHASIGEMAPTLLEMIISEITYAANQRCMFHSAAVERDGKSIVMVAQRHRERSRLAAALLPHDWNFLSSELTSIGWKDMPPSYFSSPLRIEHSTADETPIFDALGQEVATSPHFTFIDVSYSQEGGDAHHPPVGLFVFPKFSPGSPLSLSCLSAAQTALKLAEGLANSQALGATGLPHLAALARQVPALELTYGSVEQLVEISDSVLSFILARDFTPSELHKFIAPFSNNQERSWKPAAPPAPRTSQEKRSVPAVTPKGEKKRLTIGMATYDDFDGAFFTAVSIRLYHPEITDISEIVVIDNNPTGPCAESLKQLDKRLAGYRYVPFNEYNSTAVRDLIFREASGEYVVVVDCHVLLVPGSLARLVEYMDSMENPRDLLQGPIMTVNMSDKSSHFEPVWRKGMYGIWEKDPRLEADTGEPFEIPMQGLGMFACRKDAWPGLNPRFRGFGGEEGYIHEKIRQNGGRTLCLPFLQWIHRFERPMGAPYRIKWEDRVFNYLLGHRELGLDEDAVKTHFTEHLTEESAKKIFAWVDEEMSSPFMYFDAVYCIAPRSRCHPEPQDSEQASIPGLAGRIRYFDEVETTTDPALTPALTHRAIIGSARHQNLATILVLTEASLPSAQDVPDYEKEVQRLSSLTEWHVRRLQVKGKHQAAILDTAGQPDLAMCTAVAYNQTIYDNILEDIPESEAYARDWQRKFGSLQNYLDSLE